MGQQQCCSDNSAAQYDPIKRPDLIAGSVKSRGKPRFAEAVNASYTTNQTTLALLRKAGPFKPSRLQSPPAGVKSAISYLLNKGGYVYYKKSQWKNDLPNGLGELIYPDGSIYQGYFVNGVPQGEGRFVSAAGWMYQGGISQQQAEGTGIFNFDIRGYFYEGEWKEDVPEGKGREMWVIPEKASYQGQFKRGTKNGRGVYITDNWMYEGQFNMNSFNSKGRISFKDGSYYDGDFINGRREGQGTFKWADGTMYIGGFSQNMRHGKGEITLTDGRAYDGGWQRGLKHGKGTLIVNGQRVDGEWVMGLLKK